VVEEQLVERRHDSFNDALYEKFSDSAGDYWVYRAVDFGIDDVQEAYVEIPEPVLKSKNKQQCIDTYKEGAGERKIPLELLEELCGPGQPHIVLVFKSTVIEKIPSLHETAC
jgi:hypothetical protein